eukprot:CAMPEP_0168175136 /NCGR_PEP_ID=MMETSP0139_2-20121125/6938_1 /TAXON_ID=44445 /ORGANISM="Pseudo-nitzschia australis, Strain 10249 10 AB" /LENGTH=514 /DNA_ID=CAMNT_0008093457 /DNA_START=127 /DNA_END=1671 /DNA_ORIENTATION=-
MTYSFERTVPSTPSVTGNATSTSVDKQEQQQQLPVIIVGAGPCGLVAAATLQKRGVPFVILEKASRSKLCSNAGSGFELAPTAVEILQGGLGMDVYEFMSGYQGLCIMSTEGETIRKVRLSDDYKGGSVNRAELQNYLLKLLFSSPEEEDGVLICGSGLESYREEKGSSRVFARLASGQLIEGCALLACDGINSKCRSIMYQSQTDHLHYCNANCCWGKTSAPKGSDLEREFLKTQRMQTTKKNGNDSLHEYRTSCVMITATPKIPVSVFLVPTKKSLSTEGEATTTLNWAIIIASKDPPATRSGGGDSTRRGGGVLTEEEKNRFLSLGVASHTPSGDRNKNGKHKTESVLGGIRNFPLLEILFKVTPASDITQAAFFDRDNLDLPYTSESKLVALLGDAAHPQTPLLGQGVNMAITDAFIYANVIADCLQTKKNAIPTAIRWCDPDFRRKANKKVVKEARFLCDLSNSSNWLVCWVLKLFYKFLPSDRIMTELDRADKSNADFWKYFKNRSIE